jgi:P-type Ca2+ transporter type 2C
MQNKNENSWWTFSIKELVEKLNTDIANGLTSDYIQKNNTKFSENILPKAKPTPSIIIFLRQFSSFIIWLLIIATIISAFLNEWIDAIAIGVIVLLNSIIGFIQELSAQKSTLALQKLSTPSCSVIRDGEPITIETKKLIPGDLVILEAGDIIPADGRIVNSTQLTSQEALLTGESTPIHKTSNPLENPDIPIAEQKNMGFMGTTITSGKGLIIVTETGINTELGKIASLLNKQKKEITP